MVKHSGIVEYIEGNYLQVKITQTTSCSSCSIKNNCSSAESKEHLIDVYDKEAASYQVGEEVWIIGSTSMGRKAVWYGYLLPLLLFMAMLMGLTYWLGKDHEIAVALYSLGCVAVYYLLLYIFGRTKMKSIFSFSISKVN